MISSLKNKISTRKESPRNRSSSRSRNFSNDKPPKIESKMSQKTNGKLEDPIISNLEKLKLDNQAEPMTYMHNQNEIEVNELGRFADEPEYRMNHSRLAIKSILII